MAEVFRKYTIFVRGDDEDARDEAVARVADLMKDGYQSGMDRNESSGFYFSSVDEVPEDERPA